MPLRVFDCKGIPATRRERIEAAVENRREVPYRTIRGLDLGRSLPRGGVRVLITGHGFERMVRFAIDEDPVVIREGVRETLGAD